MIIKNKLTFATLAAALTFTACSEQEDFNQADVINAAIENADVPVQFDTYMGTARNNTRAYLGSYTGGPITNKAYDDETSDGLTSLKKVGFGVFAYYSAEKNFAGTGGWSTWALRVTGGSPADPVSVNKQPNFMYNEKLTWSTAKNNWDYQNVKYWPNGKDAANPDNGPSNTATEKEAQYLSFFAYAPYVDIQGDYSEDDKPTSPAVTNAKTTGVTAANTYGIVAMSRNDEATDMQLKYAFKNTAYTDYGASEANAVDLLWGLRGQNTYQETDNVNNTEATLGNVYNIDLTKQVTGEKVKFLFKHALSRVGGSTKSTSTASGSQICGLKVVVDVDKNEASNSTTASDHTAQGNFFTQDFDNEITLVTIEEVKIRDKYTYDQEQTVKQGWTSDFATAGWFDIMQGEWTETVAPTASPGITYSITANNTQSVDNTAPYALNTDIKEPVSAPTGVGNANISASKWAISGTTGVDLTPKNVFADENVPGLLLIPGVEGAEAANNTLYITVKYWVRTIDEKLAWDYSNERKGLKFTEVSQEITNKVVLNEKVLDPNKFYTIVMHLGMTSVKFEAVVADWAGTEDGSYTEEGSETPGSTPTDKSIWLPSNVVTDIVAAIIGATVTENTVNISGLIDGTLTVVGVDGTVVANTSNVTDLTVSGGSASVKITPTANTTTKKRTGYVKVSDGYKTITINLTQDAGALTIPSPGWTTSPIAAGGGSITLSGLKLAGNDLPTGTYGITLTASSSGGTTEGSLTADGTVSTAGQITITVPANTSTTEDVTWTVTKITIDDTSVDLSSGNTFKVNKVTP